MILKRLLTFTLLMLLTLSCTAVVFWWNTAPKSYDSTQVLEGKAVEAIYATAVVEPLTWAAISPIKTGRIIKINVEEGDVVKKGDILAQLDDADYRAHLKEEQALAVYYRKNLARSKKLLEKGFDSQEKYDIRKSDLARAEARISMLKEQIRQMTLVSPLSGEVLWRDVEMGEVKSAGDILFWVGQPSPLRLEAEIDEEDIPKIKKGQKVFITADAFPDEVLEGIVHWISPKGDPINKSYRAYYNLSADTKLMIGMTVETNTIVQEKDMALLIPAEAIIEGNFVWLVQREGDTHKAQKAIVKIGIKGEEKIEIVHGVDVNDVLLLPPFNGLKDGDIIRLK